MLILGRKYKFTQLEIKRLNKKFKNISQIKYRNRLEEDVLQEINDVIDKNDFALLVLNTKAKVGADIIKYLTKLQFEKRKKRIQIISIERFMEDFLHKCYIPDDHKDLNFLENIKPFNSWQLFQKRIIDFFGAGLLFLIGWPFIYIVKNKMKQESPGSLYFKQNRVGKNQKLFQCRKFRTMHENSYHDPYTKEGDSRIYPYGEFMRKTRIDELPQILNIIRGEMHLIGPRAEWNILVENYEKEIPYYHERHLVAPGITGWAQVNYPYGANIKDTKQKLMYDLYYIKHWSLWLEIQVIWKTVIVILSKKGL